MTQATPDLFRIRDHVADFEAFVAEYRRRSQATLARRQPRHRVAYGPHPDERLDLYVPVLAGGTAPLPLHMFIHGGYWRAYSKDDYCFVADAITAAGAIAAIVDYSLMPMARMATLVDQVRRAMGWLAHNAASFGGAAEALSVSGHSAGGHLAAMVCGLGQSYRVRSALCLSGLYDLAPLTQSFLQSEVQFTPEEVASFSPLKASFEPAIAYDICVGADETRPFHVQADAFAEHLRRGGASAERSALAGENHMSVVLSLGTPGTPAATKLADCIARSHTLTGAN